MSETFEVGNVVRVKSDAHIMPTDRADTTKRLLQMSREVGVIRRANNDTEVAMADFPRCEGINFAYDELELIAPAAPPAQPDALEQAREAWAQRLSGYKAYEQRNFVSGYVQGCVDAAIDNIAALEAAHAAQQQRIDELEKGLGQIVYVSTPYTSVRKIAHALLCADEKGGEG